MNKEGKPKRYENWLVVTYIGLVVLCFCLNVFSGRGIDWSNVTISVLQFLITFIIFVYAFRNSFKRTNQLISDFSRISDKLSRGEIQSRNEISFDNDLLQKKFEDYQKEIERLNQVSGQSPYCDIEDYINDSVIDDGINRGFLNLVPGVMTGLGILGTFIGLSFGLQSFNTGTAEEISNSIAPLMDGIKVAFHTSIYGMVFSLVFNAVYKKKIEAADNALDKFRSVYYRTIGIKTGAEAMNRMLSYQQSQASGVEQLSEKLSDAMAEKFAKILEPKFVEVGSAIEQVRAQSEAYEKAMSEKLTEVLTPQFTRMNDTIDKFTEVASSSQVKGVETMVSKFIEQMNSAMGENFVHLGNTIEATCSMQKQQSEQMQAIIDRTGGTIEKIDSLNERTQEAVEKMQRYVDSMEEIQRLVEQRADLANQQLVSSNQILERYRDYLEQLKNSYNHIVSGSEEFEKNIAEQATSIQQMAASVSVISSAVLEKSQEGIAQITEQSKQATIMLSAMVDKSSGNIADIAQKATTTIAATAEATNKTLADSASDYYTSVQKFAQETIVKITDHMKSEIDGTLAKLTTITEHMGESSELIKRQVEEAVKSVEQMGDALRKGIAESNESLNSVTRDNNLQMQKQVEEYCRKLTETTEKQIQLLNDVNASVNSELGKTTSELSKVVGALNTDLQTVLNKTFDSFDTNLADITQHMAGTISNMQATTDKISTTLGRMPQVLDAAMGTIDSTITEMQKGFEANNKQINSYVRSVMILENQMKGFIQVINNNSSLQRKPEE